MNLIAIVSHTTETEQQYQSEWIDLKKKLTERGYIDEKCKNPSIHRCSEDVEVAYGYAHNTYKGTLKPDLADLTPLQVAMVCDGGYSWFGGSSSFNSESLSFNVVIHTD